MDIQKGISNEQIGNRCSSRLTWFEWPKEEFQMDALNIQTAQEQIWMDDVTHLNRQRKTLNRYVMMKLHDLLFTGSYKVIYTLPKP